MPLYDYNCGTCGPFQGYASMSRYRHPASCPICGSKSARKISLPFVARLAPAVVGANLRNEKAAEKPMVMNRCQFEKTGRHLHDVQQSQDHHVPDTRQQTFHRLEPGLRSHIAPERPWLLGH
ncbi:zinc ribbon domain-containing protein [Ruegeria lacuscaerulensis]|uniref:zinc ribbon domain-containing protein n=1 Tax=Ruegeria lacuscaerulensis TaxID=55218 RepID=UPI001480A1FC|nr:zinc ribbon domain-containing protein [Ruegeria lacuscaerulensis]